MYTLILAKQFSYHKTKLGMPSSVVFHGLRKNFVTQLVQHDVPTSTIQQPIGHSSDSFVCHTYSGGLELDALAEMVAKVSYNKAVSGAVSRLTE